MDRHLVLDDVPVSVWSDFVAGRGANIARDLEACWTRARTLGAPSDGAPPEEHLLRGDALRLHAEHVELVQAIGDSILDRATARVADRDYVLMLADPDGVIVRASGGGQFSETATRARLIEGACWSEAARGTNAIGTAAAANRPTEVHGHAHFGRSYHDLVCYAAPIRGLDGRPLAVLDATSRVEHADPRVARTIVDAARSLESLVRLQAYAGAGASVARVLGRSIERMHDPALWIEAPGTIARANGAARELIGAAAVGGDARAALGLDWPALLAEALAPDAGGRAIELGCGGRRRSWRVRVEPVASPGGTIVAVLAILEPGRMVARVTGELARVSASEPAVADPFAAIFSRDGAVNAAISLARKLAASELPVMLLAETGAGKELFAQAIHAASPRAAGAFHAVNCGALAPGVLEAELFGYAAGAFTGADRGGRSGLFAAAAGGTLFLDEVAEMSPAMQAAVLRVVETGTYRRVGETRLERTDARIVCATCRDLPALIAAGSFRQDLYYRLKGGVVRIPPLRERTDTVELAQVLAGDVEITADAATAIARYRWPGNVRELKSVLAVARVISGGAAIEPAQLPEEIAVACGGDHARGDGGGGGSGGESGIDRAERDALVHALAETRGNVSQAARVLGVARSTLQRMKVRHGIE